MRLGSGDPVGWRCRTPASASARRSRGGRGRGRDAPEVQPGLGVGDVASRWRRRSGRWCRREPPRRAAAARRARRRPRRAPRRSAGGSRLLIRDRTYPVTEAALTRRMGVGATFAALARGRSTRTACTSRPAADGSRVTGTGGRTPVRRRSGDRVPRAPRSGRRGRTPTSARWTAASAGWTGGVSSQSSWRPRGVRSRKVQTLPSASTPRPVVAQVAMSSKDAIRPARYRRQSPARRASRRLPRPAAT